MSYGKLFPLAFLLAACNDSSLNESGSIIWDDSSQRIVLVKDNGNTLDSDDRYSTYDFSRDTLTSKAKSALRNISTILEPLYCAEDGVTYDVTITTESGVEKTYYSNNSACGELEGEGYLTIEDMEILTSVLMDY